MKIMRITPNNDGTYSLSSGIGKTQIPRASVVKLMGFLKDKQRYADGTIDIALHAEEEDEFLDILEQTGA